MGLLDAGAGAVAGALGLGGEESWATRAAEAAYTSPSGKRITWDWDETGSEFEVRGSEHVFPGVAGTYVQVVSRTGRRFELRCRFTGAACDLGASAMMALLAEPGVGKLETPTEGAFDVVPLGGVRRRENHADGGGEAVVEVTLVETLRGVYPSAEESPEDAAAAAFDAYLAASADAFSAGAILDTVGKIQGAVAAYRKAMRSVRAGLRGIADRQAAVARQYAQLERDLNLGIDALIADPLRLAAATQRLAATPAGIVRRLGQRLTGYAGLAASLLDGYGSAVRDVTALPSASAASGSAAGVTDGDVTAAAVHELFAGACLASAAGAAAAAPLGSREEAVAAAVQLVELHDALVGWREAQAAALGDAASSGALTVAGRVDSAEPARQLEALVRAVQDHLLTRALDLRSLRVEVLDRDRTLLDLSAQLFGDVSDERLDELVQLNDLTGPEILLLPRGRAVRWLA